MNVDYGYYVIIDDNVVVVVDGGARFIEMDQRRTVALMSGDVHEVKCS